MRDVVATKREGFGWFRRYLAIYSTYGVSVSKYYTIPKISMIHVRKYTIHIHSRDGMAQVHPCCFLLCFHVEPNSIWEDVAWYICTHMKNP